MPGRREGRLRSEFQGWFPALEVGRWYPADELTQLVLNHFYDGSPHWEPEGRVPSDQHFEFRGGTAEQGSPQRPRVGERLSPGAPQGGPAEVH